MEDCIGPVVRNSGFVFYCVNFVSTEPRARAPPWSPLPPSSLWEWLNHAVYGGPNTPPDRPQDTPQEQERSARGAGRVAGPKKRPPERRRSRRPAGQRRSDGPVKTVRNFAISQNRYLAKFALPSENGPTTPFIRISAN